MKKRVLSIVLVIILTLSMVACGNGNTTEQNDTDLGVNTSTDSNDLDLEKFRGTTVRYATWKDPKLNEDGPVVEAFEKKYGIKVQVDLVGQASYIEVMAGMVAAGNSPDIYFSNNDFPGCLSILQPLTVAEINMDDPIWEKGMFEVSTINGKPYLLNTVGNIWSETDCVFFNKKLLEDNNITTPEEYYEQGKWNFDAMTKVMTEVKALGPEYTGGYIDWETLIGSVGAGYYKWKDGKFTNGCDAMLTDVSRYLSTCVKNGLIKGVGDYGFRDAFLNGKVGIAVTNAFGCKKTGYWSSMNPDSIGFTYLPDYNDEHKAVQTGLLRGWGIVKGAKNPVAAGGFLRYYLDVNNYDLSSAFISSEAESFFFKLTNKFSTANQNFYLTLGSSGITGTPRNTFLETIKKDPSQVATAISALQNTINSNVETLNEFVQQQTAE